MATALTAFEKRNPQRKSWIMSSSHGKSEYALSLHCYKNELFLMTRFVCSPPMQEYADVRHWLFMAVAVSVAVCVTVCICL